MSVNLRKTTNESKFEEVEAFLNTKYQFYKNVVNGDLLYKKLGSSRWLGLDDYATNTIYKTVINNKIKCSKLIFDCLLGGDFIKTRDLIKEYFLKLTPVGFDIDAPPINIIKLALYVEVEGKQSVFTAHLIKFMVRAVRSIMESTYFNKTALVLSSKQESIGKSHFANKLCPKPFRVKHYTETLRLDNFVDAQKALSSNFIICVEEFDKILSSFKESSKLKALISQRYIKVRLTHAKRDSYLERRASFICTTNDPKPFKYSIGYSRFASFVVKNVRNMGLAGSLLEAEVEKLIIAAWREAYNFYLSNKFYGEIKRDDLKQLEEMSAGMKLVTPEEEYIRQCFDIPNDKDKGVFINATICTEYIHAQTGVKLNAWQVGKRLSLIGFPQARQSKTKARGYLAIKKLFEL